ncbi:MAG: fatty acid--CoA ligase [Candidatus Entotheonella factor]|uniref:Fatty acid--CoA ligase n=1 Tax=Entotheonella factor TaxID=1429438 RepID=W4LT16_ENTF1|nr:AMP-binding protein [Candidatus Entotheonella palauensis]ETX00846.1 MAG: fatty acid--CoA ligase [Candidatus Entotheonella factor]
MSGKLTQSYVHGASSDALIGDTIGVHFDRAVMRWPNSEALVVRHQDIRWTYSELQQQVDEVAAGLLALGLEPGDRVGIWSPNNAEWVLTQFATAKAGIILVNINPAYRLAELEYALNKVGCKGLITAASFKSSDYVGMLRSLAPELDQAEPGALHASKLPDLRTVICIDETPQAGMFRFADIAGMAGEAERRRIEQLVDTLQFDDPINIQFTSGTTGSPKGATLTHHNILNNGYFVGRAMQLTHRDRLCIPVPLYHCFGMVLGNLACMTHGAAMVFPAEAFEPLAVLETVEAERCTALHGVPTMFIAELDHPEFGRFDLSALRTGIMAGAPCPIEVMKRVNQEMHMEQVTIAYGMTETSPVSFQSAVDDPLERRVSTVGRIMPHTEVKIIDDQGRIVPPGVPGELLTRGYCVMQGYWNDAERTAESINRAGWMHTGDLATIDEDGYCNIVGRIKDMVIRGGENLYPREIEEYLYRHPSIQDVQVFGVPDQRFGEELCAWILLRDGAEATPEDIKEFCQGQIAHYKIPRYIKFVEEFPMTVTGKIQKFVMREQMIAELALEEDQTA